VSCPYHPDWVHDRADCPRCALIRDCLHGPPRPVSVLQPWVTELPLAMQGTLLLALRGPDNAPKEGLAKDLTRAYRAAILVNAHEKGTPGDDFMGDYSGLPPNGEATIMAFRRDHDQYPHHWLLHLIHGAEIIGFFHVDGGRVTQFWLLFYIRMCGAMHMNPETITQCEKRLRSLTITERKEA